MSAFITVKNVTDLLDAVDDYNTDSWPDSRVLELITNEVQPYFEDLVGKKFASTQYTQTFDGSGSRYLRLPHTPIQSVTSVKFFNEAVDINSIYVYTGRIAYDGYFPVGNLNIEVTYTAGNPVIPASVKTSIALMCAMWISRDVGTGSGAISTSITAGPISLHEGYTPAGKYADKIIGWQTLLQPILRRYKSKLHGEVRLDKTYQAEFDPRLDAWE